MNTFMRPPVLLLSVSLLVGMACQTGSPVTPAPVITPKPTAPPVEYTFADTPDWQDEFDYDGKPNPAKWGYDVGGSGWGNNELQNYTNNLENAFVKDGHLTIKAIKEPSGGRNYSSARLVTKGKGDFLYGKIEVRAKLPTGVGTWPAIWTLASQSDYGTQYWPDNGELDIMEHVGFDQNTVHANIHTKAFNHAIGTNKGNKIQVPTASTEFHVYSCEWKPDLIVFFVDGKEYFRFQKDSLYGWAEWPFNKPQHLLLNIAVGGNWGGQKGVDNSIFPQSMEVDYVRVYKLVEKK
jgi:beta-glucanase (GH16 family)